MINTSNELKKILQDEKSFKIAVDLTWNQSDLDCNGKINQRELGKTLTRMFSQIGLPEMDDDSIRDAFLAYDKDKSGHLDKNEFSIFCRQMFETLLLSMNSD